MTLHGTPDGDHEQPLEPVVDAVRELALGSLEACGVLVVLEQVEGRDVLAADALQGVLTVDRGCLRESRQPQLSETGGTELGLQLALRSGSARGRSPRATGRACSARTRRSAPGRRSQPQASVRREHAVKLGERARPVDEVATSHIAARSNQPSLNGSSSAEPSLSPAPPNAAASNLEHLGRRVDAPGLGAAGQRVEEPAGAAADVEHAPAGEIALAHSASQTSRQLSSAGRRSS